jgi:hypothetical protein
MTFEPGAVPPKDRPGPFTADSARNKPPPFLCGSGDARQGRRPHDSSALLGS